MSKYSLINVIIYIDILAVLLYNDNMKVDKIFENFKKSEFGHNFDDCKKALEYLGFVEKSSKGSHHKFMRQGLNRPFILAKHRPIDPAAINEILKFFEMR